VKKYLDEVRSVEAIVLKKLGISMGCFGACKGV
jgi:hypothetical protein